MGQFQGDIQKSQVAGLQVSGITIRSGWPWLDVQMKEIELAKPVADWMRSEGFTVYSEIPYWDRCIDMVGLKDDVIRVVELKVKYSKYAMNQAVKCQLATSDIFVASTTKPMNKTIQYCQKYGVGLLKVDSQVEVILRPHKVVDTWRNATKHLRDNCFEPSDNAGIACMSGCEPAVAVGECVKQYIEENPSAGWREIFKNVPNHYSNYQSMAGAMNSYLGLSLIKIRMKPK